MTVVKVDKLSIPCDGFLREKLKKFVDMGLLDQDFQFHVTDSTESFTASKGTTDITYLSIPCDGFPRGTRAHLCA